MDEDLGQYRIEVANMAPDILEKEIKRLRLAKENWEKTIGLLGIGADQVGLADRMLEVALGARR